MSTDWQAVKLAYINSNKTLRDVAGDFGIKASGVMARSAKEGWDAERKKKQSEISNAAQEIISENRAVKLSKFNEEDAKISIALKEKALNMLQSGNIDARELANLTRVFDGAQKIGLLALGAAPQKMELTGANGEPLKIESIRRVIVDPKNAS